MVEAAVALGGPARGERGHLERAPHLEVAWLGARLGLGWGVGVRDSVGVTDSFRVRVRVRMSVRVRVRVGPRWWPPAKKPGSW